MKSLRALREVHEAVSRGHGFYPEVDLAQYLHSSSEGNKVIVKESGDFFEMALFLNEKILSEIQTVKLPQDFDLGRFSALSVVIEELSHFNSLYWNALHDGAVSPLELETQAEVDKFTVALDWLERTNQQNLRENVFDILFSELNVGAWVLPADEKIYQEAHSLAKEFCRKLLKEKLPAQKRYQIISEFFRTGGTQKLSFSF